MNGFSTVPVRSYGASAGQNVATRYTPPPPVPHGFLYVFCCCCCCLFLYTLNGLMERWKKRRMEKRTRRMISKMKTEIPEWQPANVEGLMEICIQ